MHPLASHGLFGTQVEHISAKLADLRGWLIHKLEYPYVDLTFTADHRTPLRLYANCAEWNSEPPSFKLLSAAGATLQPTNPPPAEISPNCTGVFNASPHPATGLPFICSPGSREYRIHSSHINDPCVP